MDNGDIRFLFKSADAGRRNKEKLSGAGILSGERMKHVWGSAFFSRRERNWIPVMCILQMQISWSRRFFRIPAVLWYWQTERTFQIKEISAWSGMTKAAVMYVIRILWTKSIVIRARVTKMIRTMVNYLFRILWLNRINVKSGTTAETTLSGYQEKRSYRTF